MGAVADIHETRFDRARGLHPVFLLQPQLSKLASRFLNHDFGELATALLHAAAEDFEAELVSFGVGLHNKIRLIGEGLLLNDREGLVPG